MPRWENMPFFGKMFKSNDTNNGSEETMKPQETIPYRALDTDVFELREQQEKAAAEMMEKAKEVVRKNIKITYNSSDELGAQIKKLNERLRLKYTFITKTLINNVHKEHYSVKIKNNNDGATSRDLVLEIMITDSDTYPQLQILRPTH